MVDRLAVTASLYLFVISNVVSNVIFIFVVIRGRLAKQRGFLLLLNFAIVDVLSGINLIVDALAEFGPSIQLTPTQFSVVLAMELSILPSVVQVNLVLVNVSYVVETRKERVNGSRLVAALMVASPWLYALLVVAPYAASPPEFWYNGLSKGSNREAIGYFGHMLISKILPGLFACIATTLAVVSYVTRDRQEGNDGALSGGEEIPMDSIPPPQRGGNFDELPEVTSAAGALQRTADDVTGEPRPPKAEVVYTCLSVGVLQLAVYVRLSTMFPYTLHGDYQTTIIGSLSAFFIRILRSAAFAWLWLLRPDYREAFKKALCCCCSSPARSNSQASLT